MVDLSKRVLEKLQLLVISKHISAQQLSTRVTTEMTDINYLETKDRVRESLDLEEILPNPSKADDYETIGKDIREKLHNLAGKHVLPAIRAYLKQKKYETINQIPVEYYPFEKLVLYRGLLSRAFNPDQRYDLFKMLPLVEPGLQGAYDIIILAQEAVGAAIRVCKVIGRQDLADDFNEIVKGCFVPDEEAKELGPIKKSFFSGM